MLQNNKFSYITFVNRIYIFEENSNLFIIEIRSSVLARFFA